MSSDDALKLARQIPLGEGHDDQQRTVIAALRRLLDGERGVVIADEVGFGKTYEALAVVAHLAAHYREKRKRLEHVLVLCKPSLVRKWEEETSSARPERGFPRYVPKKHPASWLFDAGAVHCIDTRGEARRKRRKGLRGKRDGGRIQVPPGLYIVNERLLQEEKRTESRLLKQLWRTKWDVVIVDEAHHYARGNRPVRLFAPDGNLRNYDQRGLSFTSVLALTATPFELSPAELVDLLALVRADEATLDVIEKGLANFVDVLEKFFKVRNRLPKDELRCRYVDSLERMRLKDALDNGSSSQGLESLLKRYIIRNTKAQNERRYFLVEDHAGAPITVQFTKLEEDLRERVRKSALIPFVGEHALFYLELRDLIQEVTELARNEDSTKTFIPTDLRQGLSSYQQIQKSALLARDLDSARRLRSLVTRWTRDGKLHPKIRAAEQILRNTVRYEIAKVKASQTAWFSKVLIFNKLIAGTAPHLREVLELAVEEEFGAYLDELVRDAKTTREALARAGRDEVTRQLDAGEVELRAKHGDASLVPEDFDEDAFVKFAGASLLRAFREPLRRRASQTLALIDRLRCAREKSLETWVREEITGHVISSVRDVIVQQLASGSDIDDWDDRVGRAQRDLQIELEESKSVAIVGRYDGEVGEEREAHRRNFNRRFNPFVLLVGQVGEEGIDLQEQCRYIIHYDLEWNPARMEQREGRVDRRGWEKQNESFIDVRFLLLKGTYEERIFHAVMQREQWFQVLIGSKRRELGEMPEDAEVEARGDAIDEAEVPGAILPSEKMRVMLDLRPEATPT